jgi:hypothetical protein
MRKKQKIISENYLDKIPYRPKIITWSENHKGLVTLEIENKGYANKIAQMLFKKPKTSYIHLDKMGSFIWKNIDGKMNICAIGKKVNENFGDEANPLFERLAIFFKIMDSYKFISWV